MRCVHPYSCEDAKLQHYFDILFPVQSFFLATHGHNDAKFFGTSNIQWQYHLNLHYRCGRPLNPTMRGMLIDMNSTGEYTARQQHTTYEEIFYCCIDCV